MQKHLVIGASGTVGSGIVEQLVAAGQPVRATTSRRSAVGTQGAVERVYLDLASGQGLEPAFDGIDRAFFLAPPGYADQHALLSPLIAEATRRRLDKVVLMTAMGANTAETPFLRAERELEGSGLRHNIIRPNWFMQNFNTFWLAGIRDDGRIELPVGDAKTSFIDARDIAAVAARLLVTNDFDGRDFDLTGPEALDHATVARILARATGKPVVFQDIEPEVLRKGLLSAGLPPDYTGFLLAILGYLKAGYAERTTHSVREVLGREPGTFEAYARDHRHAWARAA